MKYYQRLVTKLDSIFVLLLIVSCITLCLLWWGTSALNKHLERVDLAHRSLEAHLSLSNHTYQLFKQYGDALTIGDLDKGAGEKELTVAIRKDIESIRLLIGQEIRLVGDEEISELYALSEIEQKIQRLISEIDVLVGLDKSTDGFSNYWLKLSTILEDDIDRDFHSLITAAIEEEREEVQETTLEVERLTDFLRLVTIVSGLIALCAVATAMALLRYQVRKPLQQLLAGVRGFAQGNLYERIHTDRIDEIGEIGATFNEMAESIAASSDDMSRQNTELESVVKERTGQLESTLAESQRKDAQRRRLLADVSHELRTPLTIIQGEADIALRGKDKSPERYKEALERSRDAARHTARLVDDLLFIARNEEGLPKLRVTDFDLRALIDKTADSVATKIDIATLPASMPIRGDQDRIRQALLVLLENARIHGGENIWIQAFNSTDGWQVAVQDDGAGLSDQDKQAVFERFYQGSDQAARYLPGSGLGLPIVKSIAEAHGGQVVLSDREGGGLIATITLPSRTALRAVK